MIHEKTIYNGERMDAAELVAELLDAGRTTSEALQEAQDIFAGRDECPHPPERVYSDVVEEAEAGAVDYCERCASYL